MEFKLLFLIFLLIIIIFYIINNKLKIKENYLTYYLPFISENNQFLLDLQNFYKENDNEKNYFKDKFLYNKLFIGSFHKEKNFINFFINLLISKSKIFNIKSSLYYDKVKLLIDLEENKINLGLSDIPTLTYYSNNYKDYLKTIFAVTRVYKEFLVICTKLKYQVYKINDIPYGFIIGIVDSKNTMFYYLNKFLKDLNLNYNDYKIKVYESDQKLINALVNDEINMFMYYTFLPNDEINRMIDFNFNNDIIILPFDLPEKLEQQFMIKNNFCKLNYFDLNKISESYLPKKFGDHEFKIFKPSLKILSIDQILITNNTVNYSTIYNLVKFFKKYTKSLNNSLSENVKIPDLMIDVNVLQFINYHPASIKLFHDFGFLTYNKNENCKYLVGKMKCNEENLKENGFI